ncbi:MAG: biotin/lipoyl-containing protein [bacterium]
MIEPELLKQIFSLLEGTSIEEMELLWEGRRLLIRRSASQKEGISLEGMEEEKRNVVAVEATSVGIFYPSVAEGAKVKEGEKIGEVETLGIREEVLAPTEGIVENLLGEGEIVEYGKIICLLKQEEVHDSEEKQD